MLVLLLKYLLLLTHVYVTCLRVAALGAPCTNNEECLVPNSQCTLGVCKCPSIYDPVSRRCETSKCYVACQL